MAVTAPCIRLMLNLLFLLFALERRVDSVRFRVDPDQQQFFEYESLSLHCEEIYNSAGWSVVSETKSARLKCEPTWSGLSCQIKNVYAEESGKYYCVSSQMKSNYINITITPGSVILESPAVPVKEGDAVTLRCRNRTGPPSLKADFYKDGTKEVGSAENMTIRSVSKSDEGPYKCVISGNGESAESWLIVEDEPRVPTSSSPTLWMVVTVLLVVLVLLLGLHHLGKPHWHRVLPYLLALRRSSGSSEDQTAPGTTGPDNVIYAVPNKRKNKEEHEAHLYYSLGVENTEEQGVCSSTAMYASPKYTGDAFYSTISPANE